jgi:hypothetical protein
MTLRKHLHMFCTELVGKKEKGRKKRIFNIQPSSLRISKANGTTRKGKNPLEGLESLKTDLVRRQILFCRVVKR